MSHPDDGVLQELLDGELAPADEAVVRAHIAGCAPCTTALAELKSIQAEADTIVSRLDLDPPLPARQARRVGPASPNLRMLGLAASAVLVAGTSWLLFRSPDAARPAEVVDAGSGIVLPMPSEERQEVAATTPAAPPQKAKQAPQERDADAVAEQSAVKDLASQAAPKAAQEAEKKEAADESRRTNGMRAADAPVPMARIAPPAAAPAQLAAGAAQAGEGRGVTIADAEERLGKVYTIAGIRPISLEFLGDSARGVRQRYVVGGVPVVLVQEELGFNTHDQTPPSRRVADSAGVQLTTVSWWSGGYRFVLQGALPGDSLEALRKQMK